MSGDDFALKAEMGPLRIRPSRNARPRSRRQTPPSPQTSIPPSPKPPPPSATPLSTFTLTMSPTGETSPPPSGPTNWAATRSSKSGSPTANTKCSADALHPEEVQHFTNTARRINSDIGGDGVRGILKSGSFWFAFWAAVFLVVGVVSSVVFWGWLHPKDSQSASNSETVRNLGILIGGVIAFVFALWRGWVAERQAATAQRQAKIALQQAATAERGLLNERYQRGAHMLGSDVLSVRLGGIYALQHLAEDHPDQYHVQIMLPILRVRAPPGKRRDIRHVGRSEGAVAGRC